MHWMSLSGSAALLGVCAIFSTAAAETGTLPSGKAESALTPARKALPAITSPGVASNGRKSPLGIAKQKDGTLLIAGRSLRCGSNRNVLDRSLPNLGLAAPGVVVFNPRELNQWSDTVRLFVFHHECGHHQVGASELGADCWAVKQGVRDGWLTQDGLGQVCRSFGDGPATDTHPAGAKRCAALNRCFSTAMAALAKQKAAANAKAAPVQAAAPAANGPALVEGPNLKRSGMLPTPEPK